MSARMRERTGRSLPGIASSSSSTTPRKRRDRMRAGMTPLSSLTPTPESRTAIPRAEVPRVLKRILLTMPPAMPLAEQRIYAPLGMKDSGFHVPAEKLDRLDGFAAAISAITSQKLTDPARQIDAMLQQAGVDLQGS